MSVDSAAGRLTSALPSIATEQQTFRIGSLVPGAVVSRCSNVKPKLLNNLVGSQQDCRRQIDTDRFGGLQIDDHLELGGLLDRQIGGLGATSDPINELSNAPEERRDARAVAQQATHIYPFAEDKHG